MTRRLTRFYEFDAFRLDLRDRLLWRAGEVVPLTPKLFDILLVFLRNRGRILRKDEIISLVWGDTIVEEGSLTRNVSRLRRLLGESRHPHPFIETVPWRGYRFVSPVVEVDGPPSAPAIESIAVLPFMNAGGDPDLDYLSDGITESLINALSQLPHLKVMSRNSVFRFKGKETDLQEVGRKLNVSAVLTGSVLPHSETLVISTELIDAQDNRHLWGERYSRNLTDIFQLQETLSLEIAETLRLRLSGEEKGRVIGRHSEVGSAYQSYLKGRFYFHKLTPEGVQKGAEYFLQAIASDPSYALAYAALADCYNYLGNPTEAGKAAHRALELDDHLGETRASYAFYRFLYLWEFEEAERDFRRSLEIRPDYAEAHHWYGIFLANMGRHEEALAEARTAVDLDPVSLLMNMTPGLVFYCAHAYDQAREEFQKVLEMDPSYLPALSLVGHCYEQQGDYDKAIAQYQKILQVSGGSAMIEEGILAARGRLEAKCGERGRALEILEVLTSRDGVSAYSLAELYAALGNADQAIRCLASSIENRDLQLVSMKVDPNFVSLHDAPRFQDLLRRIGLPT